ncbi:acyl-CoA dehydrogenase [Lysinibacillus sphaericus]|uniref:acyl-CoA dehydrogenase n=1 Tax=Lysinibacillus sphaericus TaxID=1421 RepID=UPI0018CE1E71|nr:acyl-CoA dehydrogenase [Lysinibacillus sphaericus]MBG9454351.1 acyl-CoA dehydrogenase [Lysinibacillus sphaericus]MBG9476662.1 acyl-CoA dehydrogenase [Lysinibacillus sphaericus]MBG9593152.1 acyl-CoA dehydrogenase [Lysinibacillus sphaericus]
MNILQIKDRGLEIEELGRLPKDIVELIYERQLFKLFTAKELGGKDLELLEGMKVFQQMSALDGNFGWLVTIGTGGNAFIPTLNKEVCEKIFLPRNAVIAGSGHPSGRAVKIDGGYRVTGQWKYCSGADYATTFTMNCFVENEGIRTDKIISCSVNCDQVEVLNDWRAMGLKATASHTIRVQDVWVPEQETFQLGIAKNKYGSAVHSFPFGAFAEASFISVCLGITENFLEEASILVKQRKYDPSRTERMGAIQFLLMQQQKNFRQLEEQYYLMLSEYWQKHKEGHKLTEEELQQFSRKSKDTAVACVDIANSLIRRLGMDAITETSSINRIWRNLYTAAQHSFLTP